MVELPPATPLTDQVTPVVVVPLTLAVNCCCWLTCSEEDVGVIATATGVVGVVVAEVPVPVSTMVCVEPDTLLSVRVRFPVRVPVAVGVNFTLSVQLDLAATFQPQVPEPPQA